jgi:hypothetical protein
VHPKPQTQVLHFGKPQDATNKPYRLSHQDVVRLSSKVEYVFNQLALRDRPTPERKKLDAFASDERDGPLSARITPMERYRDDEAQASVGEEP